MDKQYHLLQLFSQDLHTQEALLNFLKDHLAERIVQNAIEKKPVEALADAIIELEKGFERLREIYDIKYTVRDNTGTNKAK